MLLYRLRPSLEGLVEKPRKPHAGHFEAPDDNKLHLVFEG
jgi:hypothetical protein